jgi:hypothetical protein
MGSTEIFAGPLPVTTEKSTSTANDVPMTQAVDGRVAESGRAHIDFQDSSGDIEVRPYLEKSDDGVAWTTPTSFTNFATYTSTVGWTRSTTTWETLPNAPFLRFGVQARNISGSNAECATIRLVIDLKFTG